MGMGTLVTQGPAILGALWKLYEVVRETRRIVITIHLPTVCYIFIPASGCVGRCPPPPPRALLFPGSYAVKMAQIVTSFVYDIPSYLLACLIEQALILITTLVCSYW